MGCYYYGDVLLLWQCVTVMVMCYCLAMCYCYGDVLLLWQRATVMAMCYCYGDVLLAPIPNFHKDQCNISTSVQFDRPHTLQTAITGMTQKMKHGHILENYS